MLCGRSTGFLSQRGTKLRDWAVGQAGGSCYSRAALSSNDSKTLHMERLADLIHAVLLKVDRRARRQLHVVVFSSLGAIHKGRPHREGGGG